LSFAARTFQKVASSAYSAGAAAGTATDATAGAAAGTAAGAAVGAAVGDGTITGITLVGMLTGSCIGMSVGAAALAGVAIDNNGTDVASTSDGLCGSTPPTGAGVAGVVSGFTILDWTGGEGTFGSGN
jgi:hypothetical protein